MMSFVPACATFPVDEDGGWSVAERREQYKKLSELKATSDATCAEVGGSLHYMGQTSEALVTCLLQSDSAAIHSLNITSTGGPTYFAIWAAQIIRDRKLRVVVDGFCASSCANYIVPSSNSILITRNSLIIPHTNMPPSREKTTEALLRSGLKIDSPEFTIALNRNLKSLQYQHDLHMWFVDSFSIDQSYFSFASASSALVDAGASVPVTAADLKNCIRRNVKVDAVDEDARIDPEVLKALAPDQAYIYRAARKDAGC